MKYILKERNYLGLSHEEKHIYSFILTYFHSKEFSVEDIKPRLFAYWRNTDLQPIFDSLEEKKIIERR
jgi:hypothetical protein